MISGFRAGVIVAVLGLASMAPFPDATTANDTIDMTTTGSITPVANTAAEAPKGSAAFRKALDVLADGKAGDAYELARALPNDTERRTVQWAAIYFHDGDIDYQSVQRFAADAPAFASASVYQTRIEQSLVKAEPVDANRHRDAGRGDAQHHRCAGDAGRGLSCGRAERARNEPWRAASGSTIS